MSRSSQYRPLILGSGSRYRAELLERLGIPFTARAADVDETPRPGESAGTLTERLAWAKAERIAADARSAVVIGSDQVATVDGRIVGKPGTVEAAEAQLAEFSGRTIQFLTAVAVCCVESGYRSARVVATAVRFRELDPGTVKRYVELDRPLDCAGAFKSERAGIALLESMCSEDPTAIVGLPLIAVADMLRAAGYHVP